MLERIDVKQNPNAPHQAVISITIEIMERTSEGQVTGIPVNRIAKVYTVMGKNYEECNKNVSKFLEKIHE